MLNLDIDMDDARHDSNGEGKLNTEEAFGLFTLKRVAVSELWLTSLSHLVSASPPQLSSQVPLFPPSTISHCSNHTTKSF